MSSRPVVTVNVPTVTVQAVPEQEGLSLNGGISGSLVSPKTVEATTESVRETIPATLAETPATVSCGGEDPVAATAPGATALPPPPSAGPASAASAGRQEGEGRGGQGLRRVSWLDDLWHGAGLPFHGGPVVQNGRTKARLPKVRS